MSVETSKQIEQYYDTAAARELVRLDSHRIEYAITLRALREHLPGPPARIADVGSGPGRYAVALAAARYQVTLVDLSAQVLALARESAATEGVTLFAHLHANALDLSALPHRTTKLRASNQVVPLRSTASVGPHSYLNPTRAHSGFRPRSPA